VSLAAMDLSELKDVALKIGSCPKQELFIADSGASVHLTGSLKGVINLKDLKNYEVTVVDGNSIAAEKIGDKRITILQEDGKKGMLFYMAANTFLSLDRLVSFH